MSHPPTPLYFFFFFNDTATTEIYTLSLHDALPIFDLDSGDGSVFSEIASPSYFSQTQVRGVDRKSTRLNSSHSQISYAVFCLKKKNKSYMICIVMSLMKSPRCTTISIVLTQRLFCD